MNTETITQSKKGFVFSQHNQQYHQRLSDALKAAICEVEEWTGEKYSDRKKGGLCGGRTDNYTDVYIEVDKVEGDDTDYFQVNILGSIGTHWSSVEQLQEAICENGEISVECDIIGNIGEYCYTSELEKEDIKCAKNYS